MGTTFKAVVDNFAQTLREEPCLCAQMADCFSEAFSSGMTPEFKKELKLEANPNCYSCKGSGVEEVTYDNVPKLDVNVGNAAILFKILGIKEDYSGVMSIPEARRGVMRARNIDLSKFDRKENKEYGSPREVDGVIEMRPLVRWEMGIKAESLLERFEKFLLEAIKLGATGIVWF